MTWPAYMRIETLARYLDQSVRYVEQLERRGLLPPRRPLQRLEFLQVRVPPAHKLLPRLATEMVIPEVDVAAAVTLGAPHARSVYVSDGRVPACAWL